MSRAIIPLVAACRRTAVGVLASALLVAVGCKPSASPDAGHPHSSDSSPAQAESGGPRQPTEAEFAAFLRSTLGPLVRLGDLKTDPPVRMPNTSAASNMWLVNVKLTLIPVEDLLSLPPTEDAQAIDVLVSELNALVNWHNAYARSPYARTYGEFKVNAPVSPVPQVLVVSQAKDKPLTPIYGKVAAEWQVDHWQFANVDLTVPSLGQPRAAFSGSTMVKGGADGEAFLKAQREAIASAKQRQAAIESSYQKDLVAATKLGTFYRGNVTRNGKAMLAEVRFVDPPPGSSAQVAAFALTLPNDPGFRVEYTVKLAPSLPLNLPSAPANDNAIPVLDGSESPVGNLTVNWSRCETKDPQGKTPSGFLVYCLQHGWTHHDLPLLLLNRRIDGAVAQHINGDYVLSAELQPTP